MVGCLNKYTKNVLPLQRHHTLLYNNIPTAILFQKQLWTGSQDIMQYFQTPTK